MDNLSRVERRRAAVPVVTYPDELPVSRRRDEIAAAIRNHQVVVVAGETGSGKTTQLPKICLELGRGVRGTIGHTQPRRLAARTVAERIAQELGVEPGTAVGWKVRFTDRVGDSTLVKLMTDGILLAELARDRTLRRYDTLIIDEAHERSLNVDFILGYLSRLLPRRPDLKVVITSATIDPHRFARHFAPVAGPVPVIEVSGRTYPVEIRYRPPEDPDGDQVQAISDAVDELTAEGPGDILVFLSGEREIRDTADALRRRQLRDTEILPLYARLSTAEQHRVFQPHRGRRIVLATNVAETSLTVPGIRYVIDPGTARISRYSHRLKVQRLPIEPVSRASANQRAGRCGRTSDGVCVRLYSEADFAARPEFTDPEILRTNLASVLLQMAALDLGELADFPFVDPPDRRAVADGVRLLDELGALASRPGDGRVRLTPLGRRLAQLPVDPRLARMVLAAEELGCLPEVLVIAAALSIPDPRERPAEKQQAADEKHARFADPRSDLLAYLNLWRYVAERQRELSGSAFRRLCRTEFLHYLRLREWQDLHAQLRTAAGGGRGGPGSEVDGDRVHQALLAGLLSHIGLKSEETRDYVGARNARFAIFPGSALFKKQPRWVMAAELVETSRLWARGVAKIEPEWIEPLAGHLVKRSYSEPHWEKRQGSVVAYEKVTLYGVPVVARRKVQYGRIDPPLARELFIRHALVEGDWETPHAFFHTNRALLDDVADLEHRVRRRDILVDDETLFAFYDARIPADVVSGRHFDSWWKKARRATPALLEFTPEMLVADGSGGVDEAEYPREWRSGDLTLPLTYQFEPGTAADGVTADVPLEALNQVDPAAFEWLIPGLREELVTALIRTLPKPLRRHAVPVPDHARAVLARTGPADGPLTVAVARSLREITGAAVEPDDLRLAAVPDHLRVTFRVFDGDGATVAEGKDLRALQAQLRGRVRAAISAALAATPASTRDPGGPERTSDAPDARRSDGTPAAGSGAGGIERSGLRAWTIGALPRVVATRLAAGHEVRAYPALADEKSSVAVRIFDSEAAQQGAMWYGTRRLLMLQLPAPITLVQARLTNASKLALSRNPHGGVGALLEDCLACALDRSTVEAGGPAWDAEGFAALLKAARDGLADHLLTVVRLVEATLTSAHAVRGALDGLRGPAYATSVADIHAQLDRLVHPGFVAGTGWWRLPDLPRYLAALEHRAARLPADPDRDRSRTAAVAEVWAEYERAVRAAGGAIPPALHRIRWMVEELRVQEFAQRLGTPEPISARRIYRALDDLDP